MIDFVIVGAQKAGSTHLADSLATHPQLYVCPDEVPYFEDPFYGRSEPKELARAVARARPGQRRGIHRPEYLPSGSVAARIRADCPDARILAVLRDPVRRAVSAYFWYVQFGLLPLVPAEAGLRRLLDGWENPDFPKAGDVIEYGFYGRQLRRYAEVFGADKVLAVNTDDLQQPETFARLFDFLGVAPGHVPGTFDRTTNAGVFEPHRLRVLRARRRFAFSWSETDTYVYRPRRLRRPLGAAAAAAVVGVDRLVLARLFGNRPPELSHELRTRLRDRYAEDLPDVEAFLGRALPAWRA